MSGIKRKKIAIRGWEKSSTGMREKNFERGKSKGGDVKMRENVREMFANDILRLIEQRDFAVNIDSG
ncbi:MAG: hypothetical protein N2V75_11770 [Methanophagales archaeon]|nr:hypothetical protein [Methanophagales archaeon]